MSPAGPGHCDPPQRAGEPARPYRILVTGSRDWDDRPALRAALSEAIRAARPRDVVVVHGACPRGADAMAAQLASTWASTGRTVTAEAHPADWLAYGNAAGPRRNQAMVDLGADLVLAFIRDGSRGATDCARRAEAAGIETRRFTG